MLKLHCFIMTPEGKLNNSIYLFQHYEKQVQNSFTSLHFGRSPFDYQIYHNHKIDQIFIINI